MKTSIKPVNKREYPRYGLLNVDKSEAEPRKTVKD